MFSLFHIIDTESLYIGTDMERFEKIKDILELNRIKYKYKIKNRLGQWIPGAELNDDYIERIRRKENSMYEYRICIFKSNYEKAKELIHDFLVLENKS